jgi:hypothetical protein
LYLKSTIEIEVKYLLHFSRRKVPRVYPSNINIMIWKKFYWKQKERELKGKIEA